MCSCPVAMNQDWSGDGDEIAAACVCSLSTDPQLKCSKETV